MEVLIEVSNRHVHLTKETYELLFDEMLEEDYKLSLPNQFASKSRVTLCVNDIEIPNVRVLGPFRNYNQVEISHKDALKLKVNPPVRHSGDLADALDVTLKTEKGSVTVKGLIIAQRHLHISKEDAEKYNLKDDQKIKLEIDGPKSGIMDVYVKYTADAPMLVHIDTDDANAFIINEDHNKGNLL